MISLKAKEQKAENDDQRAPIDLICVLDISWSMSGEKIELLKSSIIQLYDLLD